MELNSTTSTAPLSSGEQQVSAASSQTLGQEEFIKLLIAQVQNQDPFEPMENGEFIGQMAQFSSVDGIKKMSASIEEMSQSFQHGQSLQAAALVGRQVVAPTSAAILADGKPVMGQVDLPGSTSSLIIEVKDSKGSVVQRLDLGNQASGRVAFSWDGKDDQGVMQPDGNYYVVAKGHVNGSEENLATQMGIAVDSVTLGAASGGPLLRLADGTEIGLDEVKQIH